MHRVVTLESTGAAKDFTSASQNTVQAMEHCRQLEAGNILLFPQSPIMLAEEDLAFLRGLALRAGESWRSPPASAQCRG